MNNLLGTTHQRPASGGVLAACLCMVIVCTAAAQQDPPSDEAQRSDTKENAQFAESLGNAFIDVVQEKGISKGESSAVDSFLDARDAKDRVKTFIDMQLALPVEATGEQRMEARMNLRRLWWVAAPKLVDSLGDMNGYASESAQETLVMMRSESVVKAIIQRLESTDDQKVWIAGLYTLGMMTEKHDTMVPDRTVMGEKESREMADRLIKPFLTRVQKGKKDPELQKVIGDAHRLLEEATDRRWRKITNPNEIPEKFRNLPQERPQ